MEKYNGKIIYVFRIREINDILADVVEYYFDFDIGVVKITDKGEPENCRERVLKKISSY